MNNNRIDTESLAGLVFELASQLHIERTRRMALEAALRRAGVLSEAAVDEMGSDPAFRQRTQRALEKAMRKLMRVLTESPDPRAPLRLQAPRN